MYYSSCRLPLPKRICDEKRGDIIFDKELSFLSLSLFAQQENAERGVSILSVKRPPPSPQFRPYQDTKDEMRFGKVRSSI